MHEMLPTNKTHNDNGYGDGDNGEKISFPEASKFIKCFSFKTIKREY